MFSKITFKYKNIIAFFIIQLIIFLSLTYIKIPLHCDEEDVVTGGWLITKGYIIYKDFFCHHMPLPYFIMTIPLIINKCANTIFIRGFYYLLLFLYFIFINFYTKNGLKNNWLLFYILILFLSFELFNGYWQLLADTLFALGALTIFISVLNKPDCDFSLKEMIIISVSIFTCITSTLISVYPIMFFGLYYIWIRLYKNRKFDFHDLKFFGILASPFLAWGLYMLITGTFNEFWRNGFLFNTQYYSQFTGHDTPFTLIMKHIKKFPKFFTLNSGLLFKSTLVFYCVKLFIEKKYNLAIFSILFTYLLCMRSDTGFHSTAHYYVMIYIFVIFVKNIISYMKNTYCRLLFILFTIFLPFITFFNKYYILHPIPELSIINHPVLFTKVLFRKPSFRPENKINIYLSKDDKIWVAPLNPIVYFNLKREPVNKNIFYLPWQARIPGENERVITDLEKNKVKIVFVDLEASIWGIDFRNYAKPVYDYIKQNYSSHPEFGKYAYLRKDNGN